MPELVLRPDMSASAAIDSLDRLTADARNIANSGGGQSPFQYAGQYLQWTETAEQALRHLFLSAWPWEEIYTSRYGQIREVDRRTARPMPFIRMEAEAQADRLTAILDRLRKKQQAFELPPKYVAVIPDTNVFIHYQPYDQIAWPKEVGATAVRLIVPLIVIDQLDEKSYRSNPVGERVRHVLGSLRKVRGEEPPEKPVTVREDVDYQLLMDPAGHQRRENSDDEILARAEHLAGIIGHDRVVVATGDHGMQLRATARRLRCLSMPNRLQVILKTKSESDE